LKDGEEKSEQKHGVSGWVFREKDKQVKRSGGYDSKHRNPAFARAEHAYYDELYPLLRHFHPTIVKFASQIYEGMLSDLPYFPTYKTHFFFDF